MVERDNNVEFFFRKRKTTNKEKLETTKSLFEGATLGQW